MELLKQAWKRYRLRSFGWRLVDHLLKHRARMASAERKEEYMFRLRAAYRLMEESAALRETEVYKRSVRRRKRRDEMLSLQEQMREDREQEAAEKEEKEQQEAAERERRKAEVEQEAAMKRVSEQVKEN